MPRHFIHFNRRQVRLFQRSSGPEPWFAEDQFPAAGFQKPQYHVTRATAGPAAEIEPGDTIWLVGQLYSPWGKLPPALDARIDVAVRSTLAGAGGRTAGYRFQAAETSRWFPLADATATLDSLRTQGRNGAVAPLRRAPHQPVGQALRRIRRLVSGNPLLAWEHTIDARGFDFVSYRLRDGTRAAFKKVRSVVGSGGVVFWDRWSLPRRLAERREQVLDEALQAHIEEQLARAVVVWGITSPLYGEAMSYSARERALAERLGTYRPA